MICFEAKIIKSHNSHIHTYIQVKAYPAALDSLEQVIYFPPQIDSCYPAYPAPKFKSASKAIWTSDTKTAAERSSHASYSKR